MFRDYMNRMLGRERLIDKLKREHPPGPGYGRRAWDHGKVLNDSGARERERAAKRQPPKEGEEGEK